MYNVIRNATAGPPQRPHNSEADMQSSSQPNELALLVLTQTSAYEACHADSIPEETSKKIFGDSNSRKHMYKCILSPQFHLMINITAV